MSSVVVIEMNEVPLQLLQWHAEREPKSTIARLLADGAVGETIVRDEPIRGLYPSQTWATLGMGVPFDKHGVYWYGDPKPIDLPFYWQAAAEHRRVGVFGSLHSSPLSERATQPGFVFFVPDVFGDDPAVYPRRLEPLQRFNIRMTRDNARAVSSTAPVGDYLDGLRALRGSGVRLSTITSLAELALRVASGRASKERLRTAQFMLLADAFLAQLNDASPDMAVFFTNHLAAAMHRYWPASFPDDWDVPPYDDDWIARFSDEIPAALRALDTFLERVWGWCSANDRVLVLVSSMGQIGGETVDTGGDRTLVVTDQRPFLNVLGVDPNAEIRSSMVPHITISYPDVDSAIRESDRLAAVPIGGTSLDIDRAHNAVTLTYHLDGVTDRIDIDGVFYPIADVGLTWVEVNEYKSGVHHPHGLLIAANAPHAVFPTDPVDSIEVAPALMRLLGVPERDHYCEPTFRFS